MDEIWEVCVYPSGAYWVNEETFYQIKETMLTSDIRTTVIEFTTVDGTKIICPLKTISEMAYSTKTTRENSRKRNKAQKEFDEIEEKKEWE